MSTLAKIFVVFNLVLTVVFFGSSATLYLNREKWRENYVKYKEQAETELKTIEASFEKQKGHLGRVAEANASLSSQVATLTTTNTAQKTTIENLRQQVSRKDHTVSEHLSTIQELNKTVQRQESALSDKDGQIADLRDKEQNARSAQEKAVNDVTRLMLDYSKLMEEHSGNLVALSDAQDQLEKNEIIFANAAASGVNLGTFEVPFIDGVVEAVNDDDELVVLSVGRDQKTLEGYEMFVHRGGEYIGKLKVIRVYDDLSGARVLYTQPGKAIKVGDRVTTTQ